MVIKRRETEADLQRAVARILNASGLLWMHPPNEGKRSGRGGADARRQGLKRGVPDIMIFSTPIISGYVGVAIELKTSRGRLTQDQHEWLHIGLPLCGWHGAVCRSVDAVLAVLCSLYGIGCEEETSDLDGFAAREATL